MRIKRQFILFFLLGALWAPTLSIAQDVITPEGKETILYMKNGNILRGKLLSHHVDNEFKIQILGGSVFIVKKDEVLNRENDKIDVKELKRYIKGPRQTPATSKAGYMDLSMGFAPGQTVDGWGQLGVFFSAKGGYQIIRYSGIGAGLSFQDYGFDEVPWSVATFLDYRVILPSKTDWTFIPSVEIGLNSVVQKTGWWQNYEQRALGYHFSPRIAALLPSRKKVHTTISTGFVFQSLNYNTEGDSQFPVEYSISPRRWFISIGLAF